MTGKKKWSDLSPRTRKVLVAAAIAEGCLKAAMLIDLWRRPAERVRGPRWLWGLLAFVNLLGPVSYFVIGRR